LRGGKQLGARDACGIELGGGRAISGLRRKKKIGDLPMPNYEWGGRKRSELDGPEKRGRGKVLPAACFHFVVGGGDWI